MSCLYCGSELIVDPIHGHWLHCPTCSPEWTDASKRMSGMLWIEQFATAAARDPRGRPTIGGSKK